MEVRGKKTYAVALLTLLFALVGLTFGWVDAGRAGELLAIAGGLAGLRHAITTEGGMLMAQLFGQLVVNSDFIQEVRKTLQEEEAKHKQKPPLNLFSPDPTP